MASRWLLRAVGLGYLAVLLVAPVGLVFWRTFEHGFGPAWDAVTTPAARHALLVTLEIALIAVPANTVFGVLCAIAIVRQRFPGKGLVNALVDLPLALSPVVVGLAFLLLYGTTGWFGGWLTEHGIQVVFSFPAMVLATIFVSLPFVVREVVPVLREIGTEQEQAAATLGELGAVSVVSGRIVGKTETMTLHVQERFDGFDYVAAYAASVVLALLAIGTLVAMTMFKPKEEVSR